ncbi:ubiquitin family protein, partial [Ostertagia ostertagi]
MRMNIRLKIMDQTDHPFEVDDQTLLSDFRLQVAERLHIPPDRQRMIFAGHVLKNENSTLSACGLRDGHVVHLVERPANVPFPPTQSEQSDTGSHVHHHQHGRFFQNMFGPYRNERERITYVVPFERSGILIDNARIEEFVRSTISNVPYLTQDQINRFSIRWENDQTLHISLPTQRNPHIASPALERVSLIGTLLDQVSRFRSIVEAEDGIADRIDEFLEASHVYDPGNTAVMNEQVRTVALSLERESVSRSRLIDAYGSEDAGEDESDEHAARYQTVAESDGSPGYVMRHAITQDLVDILRRLRNEEDALRPHLIRFERILNSRILYNIDDAEHTDTDYRANFFTVYMEHVQRVVHRLSHAWHLTSDLSVYLHTPMPRRLLPNYQQFRLLPPTEGEIVLEFHPTQGSAASEATSSEPSWRFLDFPPPGVDVQELSSGEVRIMGMNP